jgi:hypothetical protein
MIGFARLQEEFNGQHWRKLHYTNESEISIHLDLILRGREKLSETTPG